MEIFTGVEQSHHKTIIHSAGIWQCLDCGWWTKGEWQVLDAKPCLDDEIDDWDVTERDVAQ